jgi:DNA polymerase-3 subunit beta
MEFKIEKEEFVQGLYRTQSVVEKKAAMAILSNVLIEAQEKGISITATDLEIGVKGFHPAEIIKEGRSTLSLRCGKAPPPARRALQGWTKRAPFRCG